MNRKQIANKLFHYLKNNTQKKEKDIWRIIAETDDDSLLVEYTETVYSIFNFYTDKEDPQELVEGVLNSISEMDFDDFQKVDVFYIGRVLCVFLDYF